MPTLDAGVADGTVLMYNFDTEDLHTDAPGGYFLAIIYPNGEAMDRAYTKLIGDMKENPAVGQVIGDLTVEVAHRDSLAKVTSYQHK